MLVQWYSSLMKAKILEDVQHLSVEQRIALAEAIWDTVAEDADAAALPVSGEHRAELDRRLADWEANPGVGSSWEEVRARLERRE
jgi:putative addiction module component (TIGR02574 family)